MPIAIEETNSNKSGKLPKATANPKPDAVYLEKLLLRFDGNLSLDEVACPSQKKSKKTTKPVKGPKIIDCRVGEKGPVTRATNKLVSCWITLGFGEDDEPFIWSDGKLSLGEVASPSQRKSEGTKLGKDPQNVDYRIGEKGPLIKATKKADPPWITFGLGEDGDLLIRPVEEVDHGVIVHGIIDKHEMDKAKERKEDIDNLLFRFEELGMMSLKYAWAAMSYMRKKGHHLALVKPGMYEVGGVCKGIRIHCNFRAMRTDFPNAPVETYFAQLCERGSSDMVVECCVSLGDSASLPYERDNRGCQYCTEFVHHPVDRPSGMKLGVATWSEEKQTFIVT